MRGENRYDHVYRILFEIFLSRGFSEYINFDGSSKNFRNILNCRR
jgi:hypothetical protein